MQTGDLSLNWYSIPPLISMYFMLSLAVVSLVSGRKVLLWKMLAIFALLLSCAAYFAFRISIAESNLDVLRFIRFAPFFVLMSVLFAVYYSMILTGQRSWAMFYFRKTSLKTYIFFISIIGAIILALLFKTDLVITDAYISETGNIEIDYGPLIFIPLLVIIGGFWRILLYIHTAYRRSTDKTFRKFLKFNSLAFRLTYGPALGLFIILPLFGLHTQVYAFIAFPIAVVVFYIAIVRYQFEQVDDLNRGLEKKVEERTAELKQTQARLVQAEKMASLGTLAAGIAHEVNNPIGAVRSIHGTLVSAIENIRGFLPEDTTGGDREKLEASLKVIADANRVIEDGTKRVVEIVKTLKSFARLDQAELQKADIHQGLDDTLVLISHELKQRITVEKKYGDIPPIYCYPGPLNQVFLNILVNAVQAIEENGKITIETGLDKGKVYIKISDTGEGISPENLTKVFDPGFTTKGVGVGTGLGLSICYQIIKDHHGEIIVDSEPGKGTTFSIFIPANLDNSNR